MNKFIKNAELCCLNYSFGGYPIEDPDHDPCSNTYDPLWYLAPRGDHVEPILDTIYPSDNGGLDLAENIYVPFVNDLIPISRLSENEGLELSLEGINFGTMHIPPINDTIPISRFSAADLQELKLDSLEDYSNMVWDPYEHNYVPQSAKTETREEFPLPNTPYNPQPQQNLWADRCM